MAGSIHPVHIGVAHAKGSDESLPFFAVSESLLAICNPFGGNLHGWLKQPTYYARNACNLDVLA